jgi:hypothetical protein
MTKKRKQIIGYGLFDRGTEKLVQFFEHDEDAAALHNRLFGLSGQGPAGSGEGPERHLHVVELEAA